MIYFCNFSVATRFFKSVVLCQSWQATEWQLLKSLSLASLPDYTWLLLLIQDLVKVFAWLICSPSRHVTEPLMPSIYRLLLWRASQVFIAKKKLFHSCTLARVVCLLLAPWAHMEHRFRCQGMAQHMHTVCSCITLEVGGDLQRESVAFVLQFFIMRPCIWKGWPKWPQVVEVFGLLLCCSTVTS